MIAELLRTAAQAAATLVEAIGALVVVVAVIVVAARYVLGSVIQRRPSPSETLRLRLGTSLALSLEFLLGADIVRTAVEPSWDELGRLAAIAAIRTALNFFLQREIARDAAVQNPHRYPRARLICPCTRWTTRYPEQLCRTLRRLLASRFCW